MALLARLGTLVPTDTPPIDLLDLSRDELRALAREWGVPAYRGDQLFRWIWRHGARSFDAMTDLPARLRERLAEETTIRGPRTERVQRSRDGTRKLLVGLHDDTTVEAVLIPEGDRWTLCISSQVGCALACAFCATGKLGLTRHLSAGEIAGQVTLAQTELQGVARGTRADPQDRPITNIVYMGMGEPLHNMAGTRGSLRILTDTEGFAFAPRRITLSTVGLVPQMGELGDEIPVQLAVSLHAPTDEVRARLMPVNRRYPIRDVLDACRAWPLDARRRITFEYVLLAGVNDGLEDADRLAALLGDLRCKLNLIPFNEHPGAEFRRPNDAAVEAFAERLRAAGVPAYVRATRGRDIDAACGQLAGGPRAGPAADTTDDEGSA